MVHLQNGVLLIVKSTDIREVEKKWMERGKIILNEVKKTQKENMVYINSLVKISCKVMDNHVTIHNPRKPR